MLDFMELAVNLNAILVTVLASDTAGDKNRYRGDVKNYDDSSIDSNGRHRRSVYDSAGSANGRPSLSEREYVGSIPTPATKNGCVFVLTNTPFGCIMIV